ncbi:MAG: hypothetical protein QHH75_06075 [Bacillota bacterium]|nr:hypothetical protein [Bacillota bacterium]
MDVRQTIQQCISKCESSAKDLRAVAGQIQNPQAKNTAQQAASQIDNCIKQCHSLLNQV